MAQAKRLPRPEILGFQRQSQSTVVTVMVEGTSEQEAPRHGSEAGKRSTAAEKVGASDTKFKQRADCNADGRCGAPALMQIRVVTRAPVQVGLRWQFEACAPPGARRPDTGNPTHDRAATTANFSRRLSRPDGKKRGGCGQHRPPRGPAGAAHARSCRNGPVKESFSATRSTRPCH